MHFCTLLLDALKIELQKGQMKAVKTFVKRCYSEALISTSSNVADNEREDGSLISEETDGAPAREHLYHGGLGLRFKFPGDPKKCVGYLNPSRLFTNFKPDSERHQRSSYGPHI
jgi:hypothetical protein